MATLSDLEDLFSQLNDDRGERVVELKQVIYDQLSEVKEPWLIRGLYENYVSSLSRVSHCGRSPCLELLLSVRDPHDKYLCEVISEFLSKGSGTDKSAALHVLGQISRKSPSWLHKITSAQTPLFKDLLRVLRSEEEEVSVILTALLDLITLLPAIPSYISPHLQELFELFSHLSSLASKSSSWMNPVHQIHFQSILLSYFHRLYGLFPCNFLHYLRNASSSNAFFQSSIMPMLVTVRLHPLLVSHSRDMETSNGRWKKMELHDVLTESSRYALLPQEFNYEDVLEESSATNTTNTTSSNLLLPEPIHSSVPDHATPLDESWGVHENTEAAIEATPEVTPFVTPSKDDSMSRIHSRSSGGPSRSLRLDLSNVRSPVSLLTSPTACGGPKSAPLAPTSPYLDIGWGLSEGSSSRRKDSIFDKPSAGGGDSLTLAKIKKVTQERKLSPLKGLPSLIIDSPMNKSNKDVAASNQEEDENGDDGLISLQELRESSDVVSSELSSCLDTADGSDLEPEAIPVISPCFRSSSTMEKQAASSTSTGNRYRYISFCDESIGVMDLGSCTNDFEPSLTEKRRKRYHSCPDPSRLTQMNSRDYQIRRYSSYRTSVGEDDITLVRDEMEAATQTDLDGVSFAYEHLLPMEGPLHNGYVERKEVENPHHLLDQYLESICESNAKEQREVDYKSIIASLKSQLLYERNRREILGERNRRLLGKSKSSRILKEENTALKDQLQLVKSEIDDLHRQIEDIRREKHLVEEERSFTARNRASEIEKRSAEILALKIDAQKSEEIISELQGIIEDQRKELDVSRAQYFSIKAECDVLEGKESERMKTEIELVRLREKIHKMGELRQKYLEQLEHPGHNMMSEKMQLFKQAYEKDKQTMARALENKSFEMETFKSRILELEAALSKKDSQILDFKKLLKRMQDEQEEVRREYQSTYESMVRLHLQTESHTLEVRDQLALNTRVLSNNAASVPVNAKKTAHRPTGGLLDFHATRNVDIEKSAEPLFSPPDRSFIVGSPPLSSGGSMGSDKSEVMRRALESTRPIKFPAEEVRSPPHHSSSKGSESGFKSSLNNGNIS